MCLWDPLEKPLLQSRTQIPELWPSSHDNQSWGTTAWGSAAQKRQNLNKKIILWKDDNFPGRTICPAGIGLDPVSLGTNIISCKGWVKKCCVWSKSPWVIHQGWLWGLCATRILGCIKWKKLSWGKLSFLWCVLNATGAVISQEPQDFPFFLHPVAKIFCLSNNSSVFI